LEVRVSQSLYVTSSIRLWSEQRFESYVAWSPAWLKSHLFPWRTKNKDDNINLLKPTRHVMHQQF